MTKLLKPWGPWKDNPSKIENFYGEQYIVESSQSNEEEDDKEEMEEEEKDIDESIEESQKSIDPYASILKDLK